MVDHPARETRAHKKRFFSKEELHAVFARQDDAEPDAELDRAAEESTEDPDPRD